MISVSPITSAMTAWAVQLRDDQTFQIGDPPRYRTIDDVAVAAWCETHTNGTAQNPEPHPHRGISLYYASGAHVPAPPERVAGIDVSSFQPTIDWAKVAASGVKFAFVKATEGQTVTDKTFAAHVEGAAKVGIPCGAYHFFRIGSPPQAQVAHFLDVVGDVALALPPVLDVEWQHTANALDGVDRETFGKAVLEALQLLAQETNLRPIVYTAPGFWDLMPSWLGAACAKIADLWVAHYGVQSAATLPGWFAWAFWQYSATADEPGVTARGDANVFHGSPAEFDTYLATGELPPAPNPGLAAVQLQHALNLLGAQPRLVEDGKLGFKSLAALITFQKDNGLAPTGVADVATSDKIAQLLKAKNSAERMGGSL